MKHTLRTFFAFLLALCLCLSFAACGGSGSGSESGSDTTPSGHTHTFAAEWSHDEEKHWHAATCGHVSERGSEAAHTYQNGKCTTCNYEHTEHSFGAYSKTATEHSRTCSVCGKTVSAAHTYENGKCKICDYAHQNHAYGADNICEVCGAKKALYTMSEDGTKIYFGEYPQSEAKESDLKATLNMEAGANPTSENAGKWTDYGYYISGSVESYMWFIDVEYQGDRYRGIYFTKYRPWNTTEQSAAEKSYQDENGYNLDTVYWFKYEPIEWHILEQSNNSVLLLSNIILDSRQYCNPNKATAGDPNNYLYSEIREWLNATFYETAFDRSARSIIETTTIDNSASTTASESNEYVCENTNDKIFLLSYKEVKSAYGFIESDDSAREMKSTDYAKSQGIYVSTDSGYVGNSMWWLRSPGTFSNETASYVSGDGYVMTGNNVSNTRGGIVPALWIKL